MVLGKLPVPGRPTILNTVGQGPIALAVGAGGGCLDIFTILCPFSPLSPSLWETARYRLKYCLKGPLNPNQPTHLCTEKLSRTCCACSRGGSLFLPYRIQPHLLGWLVGCFGLNGSFRQYFSLYRAVSQREGCWLVVLGLTAL